MILPPSKKFIIKAFNDGAKICTNLPTLVRCDKATHQLELVSAFKKNPDPWFSTHITYEGDVVDLVAAGASTILVKNLMNAADTGNIRRALNAAPPDVARHNIESNEKRLAAGKLALKIEDSHIRAEVLQLIDGWEAVVGKIIDDSPTHGILGKPNFNVKANILVVTCPSTKRRYAHLVPETTTTAREARRWIMKLKKSDPDPVVET